MMGHPLGHPGKGSCAVQLHVLQRCPRRSGRAALSMSSLTMPSSGLVHWLTPKEPDLQGDLRGATCAVQLHDLRAMQQSGSIAAAHSMPVRDVDFARQQDNLMATAGDDCMFRLWDLRLLMPPVPHHDHTGGQARQFSSKL